MQASPFGLTVRLVPPDSDVFAAALAAIDAVLAWHWFVLLCPREAQSVREAEALDGWTEEEACVEARDSIASFLRDAEFDRPGRGWALLDLIELEQHERWSRIGQRPEDEVPLYVLEEVW